MPSPNDTNKDEFHQIDDLEHKLYDPKQKQEDASLHHVYGRSEDSLPTEWAESSPILTPLGERTGFSFGAKLLAVASVFLLIVVLFGVWWVMSSKNAVSSANIDIVLTNKPYVEGGEATPISVSILNRNVVDLEEAVLTLSYERGAGVQDEQEKINIKKTLGKLATNTLKKEDFTVSLYGAESDTRQISVKLEYKIARANAVFSKTVSTSVVLKTPPISVAIEGPSNLVQGQTGTFTLRVKNNTSTTTDPSLLLVSLPVTFTLQKTTPQPTARNTIWEIKPLAPGAVETITLQGVFTGQPGEAVTVKASVGDKSGSVNEIGVVYAQAVQDVTITSPLLALSVRMETDRGPVENLRYGDRATIFIAYQNKRDQTLRNVSITAKLSGDAAIIPQVKAEKGYYDSSVKTVTWDVSTNEELRSLAPLAEGVLKVYVPIVSKGTNAPALTVTVDGVASVVSKDDTMTQVSRSWVVQGSATLNAWTAHENAPFTNSGPLPPKANTVTTYAVHVVASAQNALSNARVSFTLPAYVSWTGVFASGSNVVYDSRTRTVAWNIGNLGAGATVATDIQVSVKPSQSHVGETPPVTSGISLEGDETDSRARIRTSVGAVTTLLPREQGTVNTAQVVE